MIPDVHGLAYGGYGGVHGNVYGAGTIPDVHGLAYGGAGGVHGLVYVEPDAPAGFQVAWAMGCNTIIQPSVA